jgi:hypothetical protein
MTDRLALQRAIIEYVGARAAAREVVDVTIAAVEFHRAYTEGDISVDQLRRAIEETAIQCGAAILSGNAGAK